ncbi:PREDICTED: sushi, von Willebrand factor type A, EGF and pentraxin domain-containing protein 1-like isoform X2 [Acropora digitifera]|uniref:sushi, von Willebrand factor type A, EGF and pentraxin domain-containing protein 1-like isoform X2 n=1 Tax=Acropora digitifera TaxID=70779 RepID=UPI00077AC9E8|nr:PREDICTED: sushi, von Willebrand factor type A, EGF and pentraxin domain-containing protein 1-like isoform X2 [Acropora digitifera]XP_015765775.1 PREDICTED: sushi, von Willebrand factor type A, EGF and pentraxin domain-containing protein 1-like isoform X2 [Acropora digitifera]XP_015765776.1 PREDICTED: sushi, von Willebrand factor type A, EGF and pentraxin domain-containing protein 1-like isoform X2 [Acropora digitifera]XP_015765777.1 PREDICTED: sushi, von Willebrand factor type A, EGF and pen
MATPKTLVILLLFLGVISACPGGECRQLFFRADFTFGNRRLIKHVIESVNVSDFDNCELRCYHQPNCVSINFNIIRDSGGFHKCELNNATHRGHDNELENKDGYIYKGAESACDKGPCKNNGTCQSGYTDKGYRCLCPPQWTSHRCDEDVNECQNGQTNLCDKDAICTNIKGSYSCHCKQGFVGNGFTCASIIPHPSAWFPLNGTYKTSEIENRTTSGFNQGAVHLSLGPDGTQNGAFFFPGSPAGSITFSDINSELDIGVSITILFWLYTYDNNAEMTFLQYKGIKLVVNHTKLTLTLPEPSISNGLTGTLAEKGWTFVGVSYNKTTAEAKLWIDGNIVNPKNLAANFDSNCVQTLTLGGDNFKGKITQLMVFNLTMTQEQIREIKGRMKLPAMIFNSAIISNNSFYSAELASFLAPVVGQMESKWNLCYNAIANNWDLRQFHKNCDNKNHTVTIIEKGPYIFGGYTDIPWESSTSATYGETLKAFIFSLKNKEALPPFKCLAKDKRKAIYKRSVFGPSFGKGPCIRIKSARDRSKAVICEPYSVPAEVSKANPQKALVGSARDFSPNNYEVFYLA